MANQATVRRNTHGGTFGTINVISTDPEFPDSDLRQQYIEALPAAADGGSDALLKMKAIQPNRADRDVNTLRECRKLFPRIRDIGKAAREFDACRRSAADVVGEIAKCEYLRDCASREHGKDSGDVRELERQLLVLRSRREEQEAELRALIDAETNCTSARKHLLFILNSQCPASDPIGEVLRAEIDAARLTLN